jgi:hypothetical protein
MCVIRGKQPTRMNCLRWEITTQTVNAVTSCAILCVQKTLKNANKLLAVARSIAHDTYASTRVRWLVCYIAHEYSQTHRVWYSYPLQATSLHFLKFFCTHRITHEVTVLIVCVVISHRKQFIRFGCLPRITHILLSWTVSVAFTNRKQFVRVNRMPYITHTLMWLTIYVALPNSKRFIGANCMPYIAHTLIWLSVSVVLPHRKQFERVNHVPCIAHATKIWTVFDASSIANVLQHFWRFSYSTICDYCITHSFSKGLWS